MKEILDQEIDVQVYDVVDGSLVESVAKRQVRDVILNPESVHLDSVLEAMRIVLAGIIKTEGY